MLEPAGPLTVEEALTVADALAEGDDVVLALVGLVEPEEQPAMTSSAAVVARARYRGLRRANFIFRCPWVWLHRCGVELTRGRYGPGVDASESIESV